ncbi:MAG: TIGR04283 family arsenosugar biosynthesis glycosyltransferase [Rhodospirillales bacterium]|nr:TIGR04283 family arsenosugar biosynthesis glycosyltransferase [Rhodospirillales bacterium]
MLSIVIPTLNAAESLAATVAALGGDVAGEIVIADGGSMDKTRQVALAAGARVVEARRGRGTQLATGAAAAQGDWLLFLHADTRLDPGWAPQAAGFMADPANATRAAAFAFALDDNDPRARRLERAVAWRCRVLGLPYGDQGLLIARGFYEALGGYRPLPLMEDVDLVRRIGRARLTMLPARAVTSAERWRREGWYRRSARNLACLSLWFLGVPPAAIARLYR